MNGMTDLLHDPGLWNGMIILGVLALLGDSAWRSWTLEGRVDDPARVFARSAPPRLAYAFGPAEGPCRAEWPRTADGWLMGSTTVVQIEYATTGNDGQGATEEWSPAAEVEAAGQSIEDWWSERLQAYDEALRRIDSDRRLPDGSVWHPPMAHAWPYHTLTTEENLQQFVDGSQRLHAYRELRIGQTGEFTTRQHMELEALTSA